MEKTQARQAIQRALTELTPQQRQQYSARATRQLMALTEYQRAKTVLYFVAMEGEIDTLPLIAAALRTGKRVAVPKVDRVRRTMQAHAITEPGEQIRPGAYGIPEPVTRTVVPVEEIDLVLVPALGFGLRGHRLGRGAGYYDRYLCSPGLRAVKCGFAFDAQVLGDLPCDEHDVPVDVIVTERRTIRC